MSQCMVLLMSNVRRDLVETTWGIVTYSSYRNCLFSLKVVYKSETCYCDKLLRKLCLDLFFVSFLIEFSDITEIPCLKKD